MILPEDTKAPISDDEDYLDYDDDEGVDIEAGYPYIPGDLETDAFLPHPPHPHSRRYAYPPPYTPTATALPGPGAHVEKPKTLRGRLKQRFDEITQSRGRLVLVAFLLFCFYSISLSSRYHRHGRPHHGPGPHDGLPGGGLGPPPEFWRNNDGRAVNCAQFTSPDATETSAAAAVDASTLRSANATFAIPLTAHEIFASLRASTVRDVYVTSYDPENAPAPADGSSVISLDGEPDGPRVMVTVEAVYAGENETSPGWQELSNTRVCLMVQNSTHPPGHVGPRRHGKHKRTVGVGIYPPGKLSRRSDDAAPTSPLEFRVHIALPLAPESDANAHQRRSVVDAIMNAFGSHPAPPPFALPPMAIRSSEAEVRVGNLTAVALSGFKVEATVGDIAVEHVRAEHIRLNTVGNIKADVAASFAIDVSSPAGSIDLTVGTMRTPKFNFFRHEGEHHHPPPPHRLLNATDHECSLPPVAVSVSANNNQAVLRHSVWEVPCRPVSEFVRSMVGSLDVYPHPLFEGPVRLVTTVGAISVKNSGIEDPTGAGRHRKVDLVKTSRHGAKEYNGVVSWVYGDAADSVPTEDGEAMLARRSVLEYDLDERDETDDAPPPPEAADEPRHRPPSPWAPRAPGLTIETSVGSVNVVF